MRYDVAVVGLGGMGSAIAAHCARRGARVIGLEQFGRGHDLHSSSGRSRLIRKAYFENPAYVPLLHRAYDLWRELEKSSNESLLQITGLLTVGQEESDIIQGTRRSAGEHGLEVEQLSAREITTRYPTLRLREGEVGIFEGEGGVLKPERAIAAHLTAAEQSGAELHFESRVESWRHDDCGVRLRISDGSEIPAQKLVLSSGPWLREEFAALGIPLRIERNVQVWFDAKTDAYRAGSFPPFLVERSELRAPLYGFPDFGEGVKAAFHGGGLPTTAAEVDREVQIREDVEPLARALNDWMPGAAQNFRSGKDRAERRSPSGSS